MGPRFLAVLTLGVGTVLSAHAAEHPLGLPPVPIPADNPMTPEKVALGKRLFEDKRFSSTGKISCATCHDPGKGFGDARATSLGIDDKTGTRNAPTVLNAAYSETMFWDGRSPSLEDQMLHPFLNPVEMGLEKHDSIFEVIVVDDEYKAAFAKVFAVEPEQVTMHHVGQAVAAFERTLISGNSPFDRWFYGGDPQAMNASEERGYALYTTKGRCVSCHVIEQTSATFTDNQFHNIGVGVNAIQADVATLVGAFIAAELSAAEVDAHVLADKKVSELGRYAVTKTFDAIGAFKTPTLRNVELTAPYMHDGSLGTLREVLDHYNNGGVTPKDAPVNDFLSGGIRPLNLTEEELVDLEAFMVALTSPVLPGGAK